MPVPLLDLKAQHATIKEGVVRAMMQVVDDQLFILGTVSYTHLRAHET